MIYLIWTECMSAEFYKSICQEESFVYLNWKKCDLFKGGRSDT